MGSREPERQCGDFRVGGSQPFGAKESASLKKNKRAKPVGSALEFPGRVLLSRDAVGHSTIGAEGLNCRVRDGNGCFPFAMATGNLTRALRAKFPTN